MASIETIFIRAQFQCDKKKRTEMCDLLLKPISVRHRFAEKGRDEFYGNLSA